MTSAYRIPESLVPDAIAESCEKPSSASSEAPVFYAWYAVTVLMLAQTCSFIDRMIMGLLVGPIRTSFGISDTQYSLLAGLAFSIFYAIMGLPLARIADSRSRRMLIAVGIGMWSLMTALCGLSKGFWTLFLARVGVGVGEASLSPAAFSMITDLFPRRTLGIALSVFTVGVTLGSGLAYMIGGKVVAYVADIGTVTLPVLGAMEGWRLTFLLVGLPGLVIVPLMFSVREPARRGSMAVRQPGGHAGVSLVELMRFVRERRIAVGCHIFGVSIFIMVVFGNNIWGPTYLIRTFGFQPGEAGWVFGLIMMLAGTAGLLLGGCLADRWYAGGRKNAYTLVILVSALCMFPFVLMLGFTTSPVIGISCLAVGTFFSAFQGGIAGGALQLMTPNQMRAQLSAMYFLCANLIGMGLGPTVVAMFTDYVFADDAAIGKSLAATAAVFTPLAVLIMWAGLRKMGEAVILAEAWDESR